MKIKKKTIKSWLYKLVVICIILALLLSGLIVIIR